MSPTPRARCRERYGYGEIATPIFEFTEVFQRTLGETSDIVTKEMYTFEDRGGDRITLRPENTAGVVRAVITGGLTQELPLRFFYAGPMFRYERPQKGRLRQFHQIGVELIGAPEPLADVEVIALGADILERLGVLAHTDARDQHAGRPREPAGLSRRAGRLPRGPQGAPVAGQPRPAGAQPDAHPRQQGRGRPGGGGRGALAARAPEPGEPRLLRPRRRRAWRGSASPAGSARAWSAAWTTTPTPPSSSPPPRWARRAR